MNLIKLLLILFKLSYISSQTQPKNSLRNVSPIGVQSQRRHGKSEFQGLEEFLTESVNNFKLEFHRSFEESRIKRKQKDNFMYSVPQKGVLVEQHLKIQNVSQIFPSNALTNIGPNGPIKMWTVIENLHNTYLFWGHSNGLVVLSEFKVTPMGPQITPLAFYMEIGNGKPLKAKYFIYETHIWIVVAFKSFNREYLAVYQYYPFNRQFHRRQTIETDVGCDFDITSKGIIYMAVSSYMRQTPVGQTLQTNLRLYEWRHTQFDFIAEQKTFSATSVKLFVMTGTLYIAVSQEFNRSMSSRIDYYNYFPVKGSPVFLYNAREDEKLTYVQIIPSFATKVGHFRVDGNDYLVFVDPNDISRIYWWAGDQFLIYQDLFETRNAFDVSVVRLPNAEIMLAFLSSERVQFFTESLSGRYLMNGELSMPNPSLLSLQLFSYLQMDYFSVFTFGEQLSKSTISPIWRLTLVKHEFQDKYVSDPFTTCLLKLEQTLSKREEELRQLTVRANKVWLSNSSQTVTAPVIIKGKLRANTITARNVFITNNNKKVPQITNTDIKNKMDLLSKQFEDITNNMNNLVYKSKNQTISGRTVFVEPIKSRHSTIKNIANRNTILNGIPFHQLSDNTLRVSGNQVINSHLTFNDLKVDQLDTRGFINNLNISDVLLADWPHLQLVTGVHRYTHLILQNNLFLNKHFGSLNGIPPNYFVTKFQPNQQINGQKMFNFLEANNIDVIGTINSKNLRDIASRAVLLNGPDQRITGQWIMDSPISVKRIKLNGLINGLVNVSEIAFNAVTIYGDQNIVGPKVFKGPISVLGNVELGSKVNGIKLNGECITTNTQQVITGNLVFKSPVEFANNMDTNSLNGIDLSSDAVVRNESQPQYINTKVFNKTVVVFNDITMDSGSTIDGTDPSELLKLVISNKNTAFEVPVRFNKLSVGGNIFAKTINHFLISDLPDILWLKTVNQTIKVPVVFEGLIKTRQLLSDAINGFSLPNDFVSKTMAPNEIISGQKIFADNVLINGNVDQRKGRLLNGIDLKEFERQFVGKYNNLSDYIRGSKRFKSIQVLGQLIAGTVNGLNISSDILLTNSRQTINGNIRLMGPSTHINGRLEVMSDINVKTTVNNHSLSQFANDVVLTNRFPHSYVRPLINKLFVAGVGAQHITALGTINGIDINDMKARVVTLNTEQQIFGDKNFSSFTHFNSDLNSDYLNGLKIQEYSQRVVLKNRETRVRGPKNFTGNVFIRSHLDLSKTINSMDIRSLQMRIMSRTRDNVIPAPMSFANDINLGHLQLTPPMATIDGLRPNQLALIGHNIRIDGNVVFMRNISVLNDILVNKLVNGCDLRLLAANAVLRDTGSQIQIISATKQFNNLEVLGDLNVNGLINGMDINKFAEKVVTKSGDQVLTAPLDFHKDLIVDRLIVKNLINGKNISLMFSDAVLKSGPQTIISRKTFLRPILANGSRTRVDGYVDVKGLVNGIDVVRLNQTAVRQKTSQAISGRKTFAGRVTFKKDVFIGGTLSGIKFPNDLILVNTNELISGTTTFQKWVSAKKAVNVNKLIDGIDLSYFVGNRLTITHTNEFIESVLNFTNRVTVDKLIVKNTINNIPVEEFVTTNRRHLINGIKTFATDLFINGNIVSVGTYNGINIHDLNNRAVSLVRPEIINGVTEFVLPVSMHHMIITGRLNGYDISDMANFFGRFTKQVEELLHNIRQQINRQETALTSQFSSHLKDKSSGIAYFVVSQEIYDLGQRFLIDSYKPSVFNVRPIESLILWTYKPENSGQCRLYSSITYSISEKGFITSETIREFGRNVRLNDRKLFANQDLNIWTNTTDCDSRLNEQTLMETIYLDPNSGHTVKRFVTNDRYPTYKVSAPVLKDAKIFVSNRNVYLILALNYDKIRKTFHTNSTVMTLDSKTNRWIPIQQLETFGVHSIDVITYGKDGRVFAALANRLQSSTQTVHSVILEWNPMRQQFDINTLVMTSNPSSVVFIETSDGQLFCVFANEKTKLFEKECNDYDNSLYTQPINVYKFNGKTFDYFQSIDINGVISLDTFQVSNHTYIAAASRQLGTTFILQLRGYNKFEVIQSLPTSGVQNIKSFWSSDGNLHLGIASSKLGQTKILTAVINGPHNIKKYSSIEQLIIDSN